MQPTWPLHGDILEQLELLALFLKASPGVYTYPGPKGEINFDSMDISQKIFFRNLDKDREQNKTINNLRNRATESTALTNFIVKSLARNMPITTQCI